MFIFTIFLKFIKRCFTLENCKLIFISNKTKEIQLYALHLNISN